MTTATASTTQPYLADGKGGRIPLTQQAYEAAMLAARAFSGSRPENARGLITTGDAAEILGVSRRTVTRMIDRGELTCERMGANHHRKVAVEDVLALKARTTRERHTALNDMRDQLSRAGAYDTDLTDYLASFE